MVTLKTRKLQRVFAPVRKNGDYLYDRTDLKNTLDSGNLSIPLNIDTEYKSLPKHWLETPYGGRLPITTQIRGITVDEGVIFTNPAFSDKMTRHKVIRHGFHPIDYLEHLGYSVSLRRTDENLKGLQVAEFVLYAHFALAELFQIVEGDYKNDFVALANERSEKKPRFEMNRRLRCVTPGSRGDLDTVDLPWIMTLEDIDFAVRLSIIDTGAIHGLASYKDVCEASGIKLEHKHNFTNADKEAMDLMAIHRADDFDSYSLGDLYPYDALEANAANFQKIYDALGLSEYYKPPKLTIGSTIKDLFGSALCKQLGIKPDDKAGLKILQDKFLAPVSAGYLRDNALSTSALSAKVEGGRCRNNRPLDTNVQSLLVDLDISGCYGEGQRNQNYYVGKPEILAYDATSDFNDYMTLREFLKAYDGDLESGAWFARVSTKEKLRYPQDFFASWFLASGTGENLLSKYVQSMSSDTETIDVEQPDSFNEEDGNLKVFYYEIFNGTLTHDGLEWILNVASKRQREELLDKLVVKTAIVYPSSWRVDSYEKLLQTYKDHKGRNTKKRVGVKRKRLRSEDGECHAWFAVNIGALLIDDLLANRKLYPKKTPLNTLYKLCVNTLYGDMTSKFFMSANVVVGNNITARARALAWYMEKGLHGFQTITDGCTFELNRVVYPLGNRRVNGENLTALYRESRLTDRQLRLAPLGSYQNISIEWIPYETWNSKGEKQSTSYAPRLKCDNSLIGCTLKNVKEPHFEGEQVLDRNQPMEWIDGAAMEHLQMLFPTVSVLNAESTKLKSTADPQTGMAVKTYVARKGQFSFEGKDFYELGTFHGTANYCLVNPNGENLKFRAYETKKPHESVSDALTVSDRYGSKNNPAKDFIGELRHPNNVRRQTPFVKNAILKLSDYKNRLATWKLLGKLPGDSFYKPGLLREFSLSQMSFNTFEQYNSWDKTVFRLKERYGQSLETYFSNADGSLNFESMVAMIDVMIQEGVTDPVKTLDKNRNTVRDLGSRNHPALKTYLEVKKRLSASDMKLEIEFADIED